jgi:hypothetical protein
MIGDEMSKALASLRTVNRKGYIREVENVVLCGFFRHQRIAHQNYRVLVAKEMGGTVDRDGNYAVLSALPTVIQSREYGDLGRPTRVVNVTVGSLIRVDGVLYRVADDRSLADPRLIPVN